MEDFQHFESKDFNISSVLIACGCKLTRTAREHTDFADFVFNDSPEKCIQIIESYWADELQVNSRKLIEAINTLKTRLHQGI